MPTEQISRFASIKLEETEPFQAYSCNDSNELGPLSLINIFIGTNNSGKSRLLRGLFAFANYNFTTTSSSATDSFEIIKAIEAEFNSIMLNGNITNIGGISNTHLEPVLRRDPKFIAQGNFIYDETKRVIEGLLAANHGTMSSTGGVSVNVEMVANNLRALGGKANVEFQKIKRDENFGDEKRFYVPILRGMRPFGKDKTDYYKERTISDYFKEGPGGKCEIVTGLELYQSLKERLLGEPEDREAVRQYEDFLSKNFFGSRVVTLIPHEKDSVVYIKIGDDKQFPVYNLGDGLQNLVICTFYVFMQKERCLFFIEEPDMSMHPSMQRAFLEVLSNFERHQYFLTTHSNHFLDLTFDFSNISVFHFAKIEGKDSKFVIHPASTGDQNILRDLGVRNSSVFLSNSTIWVEGITDRLYLRAYMAKYCKELEEDNPEKAVRLSKLREDYHYSFVEYQGSTLTHWGFDPDDEDLNRIKATYVCARACLVADGDNAAKGNRKETYARMLEDRFILLEVKEIENLIPEVVLRKLVEDRFEEHEVELSSIKYEDYSVKDFGIGSYLDNLLGLEDGEREFAEKSGTINDKGNVCKDAVAIMSDDQFDWSLTPELKDLCEKIFKHIEAENTPNAL